MKIKLLLFALLFSVLGWGQVLMTTTGSTTQDFNTLATTGATNTFGITNWFSQRTGTGTNYEADAGSATAGNLYSYGTGAASERALGTLGSNTAGSFAHGVLLKNTSGTTITDVKVSYTLEQWRKSGVTAAQSLTFYYKISSSTISALNPNSNSGWTQVTGLTLSSPINTTTGNNLNGNNVSNRVSAINISIPSLSLLDNEFIMLKWEDPDHTGADHGLAIDDVTINWVIGVATPNLAITSGTLAHGTVCPNVAGTPIVYTITNSGSVDATGVTVNSTNNTDYSITTPLSTATINVGSTATFAITFTPTSSGPKSTAITFGSTPTNSNLLASTLTGKIGRAHV